jgi:hypothetical protein
VSDDSSREPSGSDESATSEVVDEPLEAVDFETLPEQGVSIELDEPLENDGDELYRLHVRAGQLSFAKLKALVWMPSVCD